VEGGSVKTQPGECVAYTAPPGSPASSDSGSGVSTSTIPADNAAVAAPETPLEVATSTSTFTPAEEVTSETATITEPIAPISLEEAGTSTPETQP